MAARRPKASPLQLPLPAFVPHSDWRPPALGCLPSWRDAKRVAIDLETCDPALKKTGIGVRRGSFIAGISFAIEDGPAFYLPLRHEGGGNVDGEKALAYVRDQALGYTGEIVGANLNYDLDFLLERGVRFYGVSFFRDIQVAEPLIDPLQDSFSLQAISERYGLEGKDESLLRLAADAYGIDPKADMWRLPARFVGAYAEQDVRLPLRLLRLQEARVRELDIQAVFDLESRLLPVLVKMRRRGVRVDLDKLDSVEQWSIREQQFSLDEIHNRTGIRLALGEMKKKSAILPVVKALGVTLPTTATGQDKLDESVLGSIDHPVVEALRRAKKLANLRTTFVESVRRYLVNGRLHPTYNQLRTPKDDDAGPGDGDDENQGVKWGRISSVHPNIQQQPSRNPEYGKMWRSIYVPDEGLWAKCDFSSQEPRLTVHYAALCGLPRAQEAVDAYWANPDLDYHQKMADMAGLPGKEGRSQAKSIFLGLCYGMGGAKLCRQLKLPTEWTTNREGRSIEVAGPEGKGLLDKFNGSVPFVKLLAKQCEQAASTRGFIRTLLGRRLPFPPDGKGGYDWAYKALNRLIQGSGADQCKAALVAADAAGIPIQLQVHDEIDLSISSHEEGFALADMMASVVPLKVPMLVELEAGPSWGEVQKVKR